MHSGAMAAGQAPGAPTLALATKTMVRLDGPPVTSTSAFSPKTIGGTYQSMSIGGAAWPTAISFIQLSYRSAPAGSTEKPSSAGVAQ
jgi:hypothetical protein